VDDTILARTPTVLANPEGEMKACGGSQRFNCNEIQVSYETRGGSAMRYRKGASLGTPGLESQLSHFAGTGRSQIRVGI
jgi:hypothetical protein